MVSDKTVYAENNYMTISQLPFIYNQSVKLSEIAKYIDFGGNNSVKIYPDIYFYQIFNKNSEEKLTLSELKLTGSAITINKPLS